MKTIAVVEDDEYIGNMLAELLRSAGYGVVRAYSGSEALLLVERTRPDLILLDLMLPGMGGEAVLQKVARLCPVIILSAKVDVRGKVENLNAGAVDYVTKPFDNDELLARVAVQLRRGGREEALLVRAGIEMNFETFEVTADGVPLRLTRTLDETIALGRVYREGDAEIRRAIANVSHDLRTPLTSAAGYAGMLAKSGLSEKQAEYLAVIEGRLAAMKRLTEELLAYSVAASDEAELALEEVDLGAALEDSLTQFYAAFEERGILPSISLPAGKVVRPADKDALARVFGNILSNAVRYSDGDFCVTLREDGEVVFENAASALDGVSAGRLFDRFFTVENARGGTGLGLSIAKLLTERMGGSIGAAWSDGRLRITLRL